MSDDERRGGTGSGKGRPSFLEQYAGPKPTAGTAPGSAPPASPPGVDTPNLSQEAEESADPFSMVNLARRNPQIMLVLRKKNGNCKALGYSYLVSIEFDPSEHVILEFTGHKVTIKGRNLTPLFKGLASHRVSSIQEVDELADQSPESATAVYSITIED